MAERHGRDARPGLVLVDKPAGVSSFGAIAQLRPALGRRVGHAGTLDPFATGLLLVFAGRATRLASYLVGVDKAYRATVQLGVTSDTDDTEGVLVATGAAAVGEAEVRAALAAFVGPLRQVPPAASAVHVEGERAYRRFRRGEQVTVPAREVVVRELELLGFDAAAQTVELELRCSTGTYVRALARDLGEALGSGAYCAALRRTAVGPFDVADAALPEAVLADPFAAPHWREPAAALPHLPALRLTADGVGALRHGRTVSVAAPDLAAARAVDAEGRLVAVVAVSDGVAAPTLVLEAA